MLYMLLKLRHKKTSCCNARINLNAALEKNKFQASSQLLLMNYEKNLLLNQTRKKKIVVHRVFEKL